MRIPTNVILIWGGANGAIPTGYSRETTLDDKFPKSYGTVDPNNTGGSATHTHTSPVHSHTIEAHTHSYVLTSAGITGDGVQAGSGTMLDTHTHTGTSGDISGGVTGTTAVTYGAVSNEPPYNDVIFIKSAGTHGLPSNVIALYDKTDVPSGWQICNGDNSSPDLRDKFLQGSAGGADAGTSGGSYTNIHDISHSHTDGSHSHLGAPSNKSTDTKRGISTGNNVPYATHTHQVTLATQSVAIPSYSGSLITTETVEPLYKKLLAIQNQTGRVDKPRYIIGMWLGAVADIPKGWVICNGENDTLDMSDYHLKIANDTSEIGNTGGSNTHTHSAQSHTHGSSSAHTHTGTADAHANNNNSQLDANSSHATKSGSVHPVASVQSVSANYASSETTADSSNNEPPYRTVAFIQYQREAGRGGFSLFV